MKTRSYSFRDIQENIETFKNLDGISYLNKMFNQELANAPATDTLGIYPIEIEKGNTQFGFEPQDFHYNAIGTVHGGVISTLLDTAMGCSLLSTLDEFHTFTTLELKVNFLRAITKDTGKLVAKSKIIHQGKTTALIECNLMDNQNKIYAFGVSTCLIMKK